ncbi:P-loop containing nucleoside triphosphate hydrolase protein [Chytriomyces sp. MP71]|nr:P-loop containing nucleoside triphosphate hydrolase protein [Chytriomyces sp. MP71]
MQESFEVDAFRPPASFIKASLERQQKVKAIRSNTTASSPRVASKSPPPLTALEATTRLKLNLGPSSLPSSPPKHEQVISSLSRPEPEIQQPSALTTPSKTALQIAKLKAARESRRAAAAQLLKLQSGLNENERETRVYRDEISVFRKRFNAARDQIVKRGGSNVSSNEDDARIKVVLRKRPLSKKELAKNAYDIATTRTGSFPNSHVYIHEPKARVDTSKYIETHSFVFDHTFDETSTNEQVYLATAQPLVQNVFAGGMCTFFAYGQTGSGKTHTIFGTATEPGIYQYICRDLFTLGSESCSLRVSFLELYGPKIRDLLQPPNNVTLCEDKQGSVQLLHLHEELVTSLPGLLAIVARGRALRTTRATTTNAASSRSHAIVQIRLSGGGVLSLVDLAGSERASGERRDRLVQSEAAEINKSLLSLKECIRGLYRKCCGFGEAEGHVPFRGSKLTHILRDSFLCARSRTVMVATVGPGNYSVEHTLNTMRYADRVKELGGGPSGGITANGAGGTADELSTVIPVKEHLFRKPESIALEEYHDNLPAHEERKEGRETVSRLDVYGDTDTEEENPKPKRMPQDQPLQESNVPPYADLNPLPKLIRPAKLYVASKVTTNYDVPTQTLASHESNPSEISSDEESFSFRNASGTDDGYDCFQDALSTEDSPSSQNEEESHKQDGRSDSVSRCSAGGATCDDEDTDEAEWRNYCDDGAGLGLKQRHIVSVQTQFLEMDNLLLERVRSGRLGVGAYATQAAALLTQRLESLQRVASND